MINRIMKKKKKKLNINLKLKKLKSSNPNFPLAKELKARNLIILIIFNFSLKS